MSDHTLVDTKCADCGAELRVLEGSLEAAVDGNIWCGDCADYEPDYGRCDPFGENGGDENE